MGKISFTLALLTFISINNTHAYIPVNHSKGESVLLSGTEWKFKLNVKDSDFYMPDFDDSGWENIPVPSNWEMHGLEEPVYNKKVSENTGYYRMLFDVNEDWKEKSIYIRFDGVLFGYELWVNGIFIGKYEGAYTRSEFEISNQVKFDSKNTLVVKVYKKIKGYLFDTHDAWSLSGIYRDVTLFAVNDLHISDYGIITDLDNEFRNATLKCNFEIAHVPSVPKKKEFEISGILRDAGNNVVAQFSKNGFINSTASISVDTEIQSPELWNAESPYLYTLELTLKDKKSALHSISQQVGFREIYVDNGILKLNGKKITIKGVNRHDIYPTVGRAINREIMIMDLELMKKANINTIRLSHYPPHPLFIKLCNEYGMYLIDEIPFGFGDELLTDTSYQNILYQRAEATVARDKNDPSVIIWSIGNENPVTPMVVNTAKLVKKLDTTRMILLPGAKTEEVQPEVIDVLAPHYPFFAPVYYSLNPRQANIISEFGMSGDPDRPYIFTEFNHSLGGSFEGLARRWRAMKNYDQIAGGCIWMWNNQGIIRQTRGHKVVDAVEEMYTVSSDSPDIPVEKWIDNNTVIDSRGQSGTDGIVDADRTPSADYWITREVYSPVVFNNKELEIGPGSQRIPLLITNTYDFTDLSDLRIEYELHIDGEAIQNGNLDLLQAPHTTQKYFHTINAPDSLHNQVMYVKYRVYDKNSMYITDHSLRLLPEYQDINLTKNLNPGSSDPLQQTYIHNGVEEIVTLNNDDKMELFSTVPVLRTGRQPEMAEIRNYEKTGKSFRKQYFLDKQEVENISTEKRQDGYVTRTTYTYSSTDRPNESIQALVEFEFNNKGWIDVSYKLTPVNATDYFLELGLGLLLPSGMKNLKWVGDGPYSAYYGQDDASKFGIHHLSPDSLYYSGNKQQVELAMITDKKGNGICILTDSKTISLENTDNGIVFSHVLLSAGKGNKTSYQISLKTHNSAEIESVKGEFRIFPIDGNNWPEYLENLFNRN